MRRLLIAAAISLCTSPVFAQLPAPPATASASLTSTSCPGTGCVVLNVSSYASAAVQVTGTWTATLTFEVSLDGATYQTVNATPTNSTSAATTTTSNGIWNTSVTGAKYLRVRVSSYTSGTAVVTLQAALAGGGSGGGGGGGSGPSGTIGAAVPATASPVAVKDASGNLAYITLDGSGNVPVAVTGAGSGGTSSTDGAAYTAGTTAGTPTMGARDDTGTTACAEDKVCIARLTSARALMTDSSATTQPISASSLPLPTGAATLAKQPALGTAGAAAADVITVQGIASMTPVKVDGSAVTQPVSASSLPLPTGASIASKQPAIGTAGVPSADVLSVQGASTSATLQSAATANGNGTALTIDGMASVVVTANCATCSGGTGILFEVSEDGTNFASRMGHQTATSTWATNTTTAGVTVWSVPVAGFSKFRARIFSYSAGTVTVTAHATPFPDAEDTVTVVNPSGSSLAVSLNNVNGGTTAAFNTGAVGATTIRTTLATDVALPTGTNTLGSVKQTDGTTVVLTDPCRGVTKTSTTINIATATTTRIIAPTAAKKTYPCSIFMFSAGTQNVGIVEGTGGTCGTGTAGVIGGTTAATGLNLTAQTGFTLGNGSAFIAATAGTNVDFCLITSAAVQLSGVITWVQQ